MEMMLEGGEGGELDVGEGGGADRLGEERIRTSRFHELANKGL